MFPPAARIALPLTAAAAVASLEQFEVVNRFDEPEASDI